MTFVVSLTKSCKTTYTVFSKLSFLLRTHVVSHERERQVLERARTPCFQTDQTSLGDRAVNCSLAKMNLHLTKHQTFNSSDKTAMFPRSCLAPQRFHHHV